MSTFKSLVLAGAAAAFFTACGTPIGNKPANSNPDNSNANAAKPVPSAPTAVGLLALEKQANEAYIKGDSSFFEDFLSDKFVMHEGGARFGKPDAVKMISGVKCNVEEGWALTQPQMSKIDNDTYVLSYKSNMEGSCTADGTTEAIPGPVRAATVWVRNGEKWQAAFHGENLIVDPKAPPPADQKEEPKKDDKAASNANTSAAPSPTKPAADPITDALMAAENTIWDAWMKKDAKRIEALTAGEITFVNFVGTYFANKAEVVKDWTGTTCDVRSFTLTDGVGTSISPTVGILTLTGTVEGTCGGKDISGQKIYGNSVYVKEGDAWKWVFGFNSPS
ncbi:hypothetical protein BH20ACI2_BH20ACI2_23800 [soil metagenome]